MSHQSFPIGQLLSARSNWTADMPYKMITATLPLLWTLLNVNVIIGQFEYNRRLQKPNVLLIKVSSRYTLIIEEQNSLKFSWRSTPGGMLRASYSGDRWTRFLLGRSDRQDLAHRLWSQDCALEALYNIKLGSLQECWTRLLVKISCPRWYYTRWID